MFHSAKETKYIDMIHSLAYSYKISPKEAEQLTELDYYVMVGNINRDDERDKYIQKTYKK